MDRDTTIAAVEEQVIWWIKNRTKKIKAKEHASMAVNPFLAPLLCALHGLTNAKELAEFVTAGHFYIGDGTGFGKLIDEKILPNVFGTQKLGKAFRKQQAMTDSDFDDIDHVVIKDGKRYLLSQKAGKWTIQLGQAVKLNNHFESLIKKRNAGTIVFDKIIVGVFYGHADDLTDKYRLVRGISLGAEHNVVNLADDVYVYAGREFWSWLGGNVETQQWVMHGIFRAIERTRVDEAAAQQATLELESELTGMLGQVGDIRSETGWIEFIEKVNR